MVDQLTAKIDRLKETTFLIQREEAAFKAQHVTFSKSAEGMQELLAFAANNLLAPGLGATLLREYAGPQAANIQAFDVESLAHFSPSAYVLDRCTRLSGNWDLSCAGVATDLSEFAYFMKKLFEGVQLQFNSSLQSTSPVVDHHVFQHSVYSVVCSMMDMFCPSSKVFISPFAVLTQIIVKSVTQSFSEAVNVVGRSLPGELHSQAMSKLMEKVVRCSANVSTCIFSGRCEVIAGFDNAGAYSTKTTDTVDPNKKRQSSFHLDKHRQYGHLHG